MPTPMSLDERVLSLAEEALGAPVAVAADLTRTGSEATVLRLIGRDRGAILKLQPNRAKHARELQAYRHWLPTHPGPAATLLAAREDPPSALLVGDLGGRADPPPDAPGAREVHEAAGAWLARLHALGHRDDDPVPPERAYGLRAEASFARAEGAAPAALLAAARVRVEEAARLLRGRPRVPCHRDFAPHNWIADGGRLLGVVDFEHARPDLAAADLVRVCAYHDRAHPALGRAFRAGYASVAGAVPAVPVGLRILDEVGTLAWAHRHGDDDARDGARGTILRLLDAEGSADPGGD